MHLQRSRLAITLCCIAFLFVSCVHAANFNDPDYRQAVEIASMPLTENRLDPNLWALNPAFVDHALRFDDEGRVLMVTWTGGEYYDGKEGQEYIIPDFVEVWLAPVPQLKTFFSSTGRSVSVRRLEQAYGLPPDSGYTKLVTMWVDPDDLVRPCPDPAVSDTICETNFPVGYYVEVSQDYQEWFTQRRATIYDCDSGNCYPWTGLGYTYDWGADAVPNHIGLSEYIKPEGHAATVVIDAVKPTMQYFTVNTAPFVTILLEDDFSTQ
ncbi:hypothetical protein [Desulfovibrio inopinatus]|uniref:hypothetical protein n=1 Tax=Desulfovibrio inopinatus TaxID=102109 RepID=UPI00041837C4|nr:hypothetical protein [Desulfovibrio inopinatus]